MSIIVNVNDEAQHEPMKEGNTMTEITLKDGRIFNCATTNIEYAIAKITDYLFCEYDEKLSIMDIEKIDIVNK